MSLKAMVWAWEQRVGSPVEKLVLLALADSLNTDNDYCPNVQWIADRCQIKEVTVRRTLRKLRREGLICVHAERGRHHLNMGNDK